MSRATAEIGSTANSYAILAKLATGGMAEIFLARGASVAGVERYVVLKRVLRERAADPHFIRMFLDEARLAAQLQHPNVAQVFDIGKLGDSYFFTMEYVHGETVRAVLQRSHALQRPVPVGSVLAIAAGAAAGLHHAHERIGIDGKPLGIVHRDVTPSNLMITYDGNVKVVDFGVAKASHRSTETRSGTVKGKISYLAPEQCRGLSIDRRSDLFSLGIVMWELLTLERLFKRASDFENMAAIVNEDVPPPSARRPEIRPAIDRIVMKLLSKSPTDRYNTADELIEAIDGASAEAVSPISAASLGRFTRELFGQRPEPWIELASHEHHSDVITVTSEPIPAELVLPVAPALDQQLARVRTLHTNEMDSESGAVPPGPTVPMPVVDSRGLPTVSQRAAVPMHTLVSPVPPPPTPSVSLPNVAVYTRPHSHSHSGSAPSLSTYAAPPDPRRAAMLWFVGIMFVIGGGVGLALALRGPAATARSDAALTLTMPSLPPSPPDAAVAIVEPPTIAQPPTIADAAVEMMTADAEVLAADPEPVETAEPTIGPTPAPRPAHKARPRPSPSELYAAGKYADAAAACSASASMLAANAPTCTEAACRAGEGAKARRWYPSVPAAKRGSVTQVCDAAGVVLVDRPNTADCKTDPFACPH